jgi:hypothetical protein
LSRACLDESGLDFFSRRSIVTMKLLLQVSCGAPFFLLVFTHAARSFLGKVLLLFDLITFPKYAVVLLFMNASMLGTLKRRFLTSLFCMWSSFTCCHFIFRILLTPQSFQITLHQVP